MIAKPKKKSLTYVPSLCVKDGKSLSNGKSESKNLHRQSKAGSRKALQVNATHNRFRLLVRAASLELSCCSSWRNLQTSSNMSGLL